MKIRHFITLDTGRGPVSLLEIDRDGEISMIRVTHNALFERTAKVDPVQARAMIERMPDLTDATTSVLPEHAAKLEKEILAWMTREMDHVMVPQAIRWTDDGDALTFRTEGEAADYDSVNGMPSVSAHPAKRRRVMMD